MDSDKLITVAPDQQPVRIPNRVYKGDVSAPVINEQNIAMDLLHILLKRRMVIVATLVIVLVVTALVSLRMRKTYEAVSRVVINRDTSDMYRTSGGVSTADEWDSETELDTQVKILQSDAIIEKTIEKLANRKPGAPPISLAAVLEQSQTFKSHLKISVMPRTRVIEVRYSGPGAVAAADAANALIDTYVEQNIQTRFDSVTHSSEFLSKQLTDLKVRVETSQEKLVQYQKENGILGLDEKQNIITSRLDDLNKELTQAEADRIQKEAANRLLTGGRASLISANNNDALVQLHKQESELRTKLAEWRIQFGPSYPKVVEAENQIRELDAQIASEETRIASRIRTEYQFAVQREGMLRNSLEQQKVQANQLNEKSIQFVILKREAESNRQLYDGLLQKLKEAGVSAGLKSSNIRIIDRARAPQFPSTPDIPRNMGLALLLGVFGGIACAFILESLDNTIYTAEQVESVLMVPALGMVPRNVLAANAKGRKQLPARAGIPMGMVTHTRPRSNVAEAYRALRTSVLLSTPGAPPKVIVFTSAMPQEGKTSTAVNLGVVLAQKGARVLMLDCDLRRPTLHRMLSETNQKTGMSTLLVGQSRVEDVVHTVSGVPTLSYVLAGQSPPRPADLLGSNIMRDLLERWRQEYDHIIIDTPPVLSVTDAVVTAVMADCVLLVVRAGQTRKEALHRARELLRQVNVRVTGVVLNDVNAKDPYYAYYYGARYGGRYYQD